MNGWLITVLRIFVEQRGLGVIKGPEFTVRLGGWLWPETRPAALDALRELGLLAP